MGEVIGDFNCVKLLDLKLVVLWIECGEIEFYFGDYVGVIEDFIMVVKLDCWCVKF